VVVGAVRTPGIGVIAPLAEPEAGGGQRHNAAGEEERKDGGQRDATLAHVVHEHRELDGAGHEALLGDQPLAHDQRLQLVGLVVVRVHGQRAGAERVDPRAHQRLALLLEQRVLELLLLVVLDVLLVGLVVLEVRVDELGEGAIPALQLFESACLSDGAVLEHDDGVDLGQKAERVGHKHPRLVPENTCHKLRIK